MAKQTATDLLKDKIRTLEIRQAEQGKALRQEFMTTYENLKPINLLKNSVKDFSTSGELKKVVFETTISLLGGLLTRKTIASPNSHPFVRLLASLFQLGITNVLTRHQDTIYQFLCSWVERLYPSGADTNVQSETTSE